MVFHSNPSRHRHDSTMPIDQLPAGAFASHAAAAQTAVTWSHSIPLRAYTRHLAAGVRRSCAIIGLSGSIVLLVGVVLAFFCTVCAIQLDVPYPMALLAGYITVAASACVCAALVAIRFSAPKTETVGKRNSEPNYAAWKLVGKLRVADASRLWCGINSGHHATSEVMAWACAILDAIERGELPKSDSTGPLAQYKIGWHTEVERDALKAWAKSKGHSPRFLCD